MAVSGNDIIKQATKYLGKNGSFVWKYYGLNSGTAWCAAFVSYVLDKVGLKSKFYGGKPVFYVPYAQQWLHNNAKIIYEKGNGSLAKAQAGDIIIFTWGNWSRDHIGFCRAKGTVSTMYTIEGNTKYKKGSKILYGRVANQTRPKKYIYGVYRLKGISDEPYDYTLTVDGDWGTATTITTQHVLGCAEDGEMGPKTWKAVQKKIGATVDGEPGTETWTCMQKSLNDAGITDMNDKMLMVNGKKNKATISAWQKWLNKQVAKSTTSVAETQETVAETSTTTNKTKKKYAGDMPKIAVYTKTTCKVGQATSDERGKTKGGKPGDQTHGEVGISKYSRSSKKGAYNNWKFVVRIKKDENKKKAVKCMRQICANDNIGYNQRPAGGRSALYKALKAVKFDGSKITKKVDTSCTPLVEACLRAGSVPIATGSDAAHFKEAAKKCTKYVDILTDSKYLTSSKYLKAGDALCSGKHSAMVVQTAGTVVQFVGLKKNDSRKKEVKKWQKYINWYNGKKVITVDGAFGDATLKYTKAFQKNNNLEVDGIVGSATIAKAKEIKR